MEIPEFMFGGYQDVKRRCRKFLREFKKGARWEDLLSRIPLIDSKDKSGFYIMEGPARCMGQENHFIVHALLTLFAEDRDESREEEIFNKHLETAWGTLSLMAGGCGPIQNLHDPKHRHLPFIKSVLRFWDIYIREGKKFSLGTDGDYRIWDLRTNLKNVLARQGVPNESLRAPLPHDDLEALVKKYQIL